MSNFWQRTLTGFFFVLAIVALVFSSRYSFLLLLGIINVFCLNEFYLMTLEPQQHRLRFYLIGVSLLALSAIPAIQLLNLPYWWMVVSIPFLFLFFFIQLRYHSEKPFQNIATGVLGLVYITTPLALFNLISTEYLSLTGDYLPRMAMSLFILTWTSDTAAYLVGRAIGRNKIFERISPKKTIEGTLGGIIITIVTAWFLSFWVTDAAGLVVFSPMQFAGIGAMVAIFGPLGDFSESQLKRSLGVKDSGHLLPGHGGFLDRFDAFLLHLPFVFFYLAITR